MSSIDDLSPDQRAVLELVLGAGRSYDQIAQILSIDRAGVRERALAALDALGPQTRISAERRGLITDYLLGALPPKVADEVRDHLAQSASERAWARVVASELQGIAKDPLPEIPGGARETPPAVEAPAPAEAAPVPEPAASPPEPAPVVTPAAASAAASETPPSAPPGGVAGDRASSRRGGAILLGRGAIAVIAVVLVLVLTGGGTKHHAARAAATTPRSTTTPAAKVVASIALKPPSGASRPLGLAEVLKVQGRVGIAIVAQGLTANSKSPPNAYAVWLYNSPTDSQILGFVSPAVGSNGQMRTAGALPTNAHHFQKLVLTLETQSKPKIPGTIVLEGALTGV